MRNQVTAIALTLAALAGTPALAQPFQFQSVAHFGDTRPGGGTTPATGIPLTDGEQIIFTDGGRDCLSTIDVLRWTFGGGLQFLIDCENTARPLGTGFFQYAACTGYLERLRPGAGWATFFDFSGGSTNFGGVYGRSNGGIDPLVILGVTVLPDLGVCNSLSTNWIMSEGRNVFFEASGQSGGTEYGQFVRSDSGVVRIPSLVGRPVASPGGSVRSATLPDAFRSGQLSRLGVDNSSWAWYGVFIHDVASGVDTEVANNANPLPPFAARFQISQSHLALDGAGGVTMLVSGRHSVTDQPANALYLVRGGQATLIATNDTPLPGGGTFGSAFGVSRVAAHAVNGRSLVAFQVNNGPAGGSIWLWDGRLRRVIGPGDPFDGGSVFDCRFTRESIGTDPFTGEGVFALWVSTLTTGGGVYKIGGLAPVCRADYNGDGGVDGDDVIAFFALWDVSDARADFNDDGGVDGDDIIAFFAAWDAGGGPGCG